MLKQTFDKSVLYKFNPGEEKMQGIAYLLIEKMQGIAYLLIQKMQGIVYLIQRWQKNTSSLNAVNQFLDIESSKGFVNSKVLELRNVQRTSTPRMC